MSRSRSLPSATARTAGVLRTARATLPRRPGWLALATASVFVVTACGAGTPDEASPATTPASGTPASSTSTTTSTTPSTTSTVADGVSTPATVTTTTNPEGGSVGATIDPCNEQPAAVVEQALNGVRGGQLATAACLRPAAVQQLDVLRGESFGFEVEPTGTTFENPQAGTSGTMISAAIDFDGSSETSRRLIQVWTFVDTDSGLVVDSIEEVPTGDIVAAGETAVLEYLGHLADGRYDDAAGLLGEGGLGWDERFDISVLPSEPQTTSELAAALEQWCANGALCDEPTSTTARSTIRAGAAEVTATWASAGTLATATILGRSYEGVPAVTGLPPLVGDASLPALADATGARVAVVRTTDGRVLTWEDGMASELPIPTDSFPWSDGTFVYWQVAEDRDDDRPQSNSIVADLSGNIICEVSGRIHRVRQLADGSYVASVEREPEFLTSDVREAPVPNFAVDCASDDTQPIEPRRHRSEGGGRSTSEIGGRTFTFNGDAEGNADVLNDAGISINGDDYAGFHTFSPDASLVVYGDYGVSFSPHVTRTIRARSTTNGALLWSFELPRVFASLDFTESRVLVSLPPSASQQEPWRATESIVVIEAASGLRVASVPTTFEIIHLS